jgi:rRNA maturation RNase YbeY
MPVTIQHVIGTISILVLAVAIGLSFGLVTSFAQADIQKKELAQLVVHGVLHLLGFDHVDPGAGADMEARQREIVSGILKGES